MSGRGWSGSTANAGSVILGAEFWKKGTRVSCLYLRTWQSRVGPCYEFLAVAPAKLVVFVDDPQVSSPRIVAEADGKRLEIAKFSVGSLKGFEMAIQDLMASGFPGFKSRDRVHIECIGFTKAKEQGFDEMVEFKIDVEARDAAV